MTTTTPYYGMVIAIAYYETARHKNDNHDTKY
jgi:hypothetical protein